MIEIEKEKGEFEKRLFAEYDKCFRYYHSGKCSKNCEDCSVENEISNLRLVLNELEDKEV